MRLLYALFLNSSICIFLSITILLFFSSCNEKVSENGKALESADSVFPIRDDLLAIDSTTINLAESGNEACVDPALKLYGDSLVEAYGIVQSSGIREFDNHSIEAEYQVETLDKSFFLLTQMNLDKYWGKRVRVKGRLVDGWTLDLNTNPKGTFGRIPLMVDSINEISNDTICSFRYILKADNYYDHRTRLSGYILRRHRISSDISMDYSLALDQPIIHPEDSSTILERIDLYPAINFDTLNWIIDQQHHITTFGYISG